MNRSAAVLATFMGIAGASHFVVPAYFRGMVPQRLPATPVVGVSGLLDIGAGALVAFPATRRAGGLYTSPLGAAARPLVNLGFIGWALRVATARTPPSPR